MVKSLRGRGVGEIWVLMHRVNPHLARRGGKQSKKEGFVKIMLIILNSSHSSFNGS